MTNHRPECNGCLEHNSQWPWNPRCPWLRNPSLFLQGRRKAPADVTGKVSPPLHAQGWFKHELEEFLTVPQLWHCALYQGGGALHSPHIPSRGQAGQRDCQSCWSQAGRHQPRGAHWRDQPCMLGTPWRLDASGFVETGEVPTPGAGKGETKTAPGSPWPLPGPAWRLMPQSSLATSLLTPPKSMNGMKETRRVKYPQL